MVSGQCGVFSVRWSVVSSQCSVVSEKKVKSKKWSVFSVQCSVWSVQCSVANKSTFSLSLRGTRSHIKMLDSMTNEMFNEKSHKDNVMLPYVSMTNWVLGVVSLSLSHSNSVQCSVANKINVLFDQIKKAQNSSEPCAFLVCFVVK